MTVLSYVWHLFTYPDLVFGRWWFPVAVIASIRPRRTP